MKNKFETSFFERLSYGGFFLGQNIIYVLQLQFLTFFYTEQVGLTLAHTTLLLFIAKIWDACNDPLMGAIVDKCNFKGGKYLPWIKFVTYALPLTSFFVFVNIGSTYSLKLLFAYFTYILWGMTYTVSDAPLFSLSTVMTSSTYERDNLISKGRFAAALAAITSALFMTLVAKVGWTWTALVYYGFSFLTMVPLNFLAKERVKYVRSSKISFKKIFLFLFKNKYLLLYYVGFFALELTNTLQVVAVYFANSNLGDESLVTIMLAVTILPVLLISPFLPKLISLLGKKKLTIVCCFVAAALSVLQYFIGYSNFIGFLVLLTVRILFMQIPILIYGMFTADCIEYGAYINGERTEAIAFSVQTFITKLGGAFCSVLCLMIMKSFGYIQQSVTQTAQAKNGIWITMTFLPAAGFLFMIIIMMFYKLDEKTVAEMIEKNRQNTK